MSTWPPVPCDRVVRRSNIWSIGCRSRSTGVPTSYPGGRSMSTAGRSGSTAGSSRPPGEVAKDERATNHDPGDFADDAAPVAGASRRARLQLDELGRMEGQAVQ